MTIIKARKGHPYLNIIMASERPPWMLLKMAIQELPYMSIIMASEGPP
jgi:hypothetical protein